MFLYPKFNKNGLQQISRLEGKTAEMQMDIAVYKLQKGERVTFCDAEQETAVLLLKGNVELCYNGLSEKAERSGLFSSSPVCLHVCKGVKLLVEAKEESEVLVQKTPNSREFSAKLYRKEDMRSFVSCEGRWEKTAERDVVTIFDYSNAPYSNMVLGEVYARQGRWWSFIPHWHPQPEVYYYRFEREEGFGACFIGEKSYTIKDGSAGLFEGGKTHAQVTAPGYPMYCCWMIRHLDGNPWKETRTDDPRYTWLLGEK